ncbi:probable LRR receptor-like serine/threonine-protein kinase At1g06840 isoform X2 [Dioscorea cayenensis subsp. rotundata]|nr:probable LRR receptor-like serine/threonine-protein kinase At1g06840 isoform X2 [Dioscorea cayenensis subsp. rotundata]
MWNNISGSIPKEIGNITSLELLLLSGNQLSGSLPAELGYLSNLKRMQIDQNHISASIPESFASLNRVVHLHMNNNSLSGQIPQELSRLKCLLHLLLDNNNLSGFLPSELSKLPILQILQLDNNNFSGNTIPDSYVNMTELRKLRLRNCSLQGRMPDLSMIPQLTYIDLSWNQLEGSIPANKLSDNMTTIDLSNNFLGGSIPSNLTSLPSLQRLSLENNILSGPVPAFIWRNTSLSGNKTLILNFQNNSLTEFSDVLNLPANVTVLLFGNKICANGSQASKFKLCQPQIIPLEFGNSTNSDEYRDSCPTNLGNEYNQSSPILGSCVFPVGVGFRLKSPGFSYFHTYEDDFKLSLPFRAYQLHIDSYAWEEGPRLRMSLKIYPNNSKPFNDMEIQGIEEKFRMWQITLPSIFGPYELLSLRSPVQDSPTANRVTKLAAAGIVLGAVTGAIVMSVVITVFIMRKLSRNQVSKRHSGQTSPIKIDGVKWFSFEEMALATNNFSSSNQIGEGGYGQVYKGILVDGTHAAIKRARQGSLQGSKEFLTEIMLLSRLHHRNLVTLIGYCDEECEQMLIYEFMPNGTLRDHLSAGSKAAMNFSRRLQIAAGSARGILYLHTEANPPIFHRDIKTSNILLDSKFAAKVADFGLSKLAPIPDAEGTAPDDVLTAVKGTPGYLDPEYFRTNILSDTSDVYSLGVVFLELVTGMLPISNGKNIVREVNHACQSGKMFSMIDSRMDSYSMECVKKFMSLARKCCRDEMKMRPSMSEVVRELEVIWEMNSESDTDTNTDTTTSHSFSLNSVLHDPVTTSSFHITTKPYIRFDDNSGETPTSLNPVRCLPIRR